MQDNPAYSIPSECQAEMQHILLILYQTIACTMKQYRIMYAIYSYRLVSYVICS